MSQSSSGLMSSAGLVTHAEEETSKIVFDPRSVVLFAVMVALFFFLINLFM